MLNDALKATVNNIYRDIKFVPYVPGSAKIGISFQFLSKEIFSKEISKRVGNMRTGVES